jgi:VanZ family protein
VHSKIYLALAFAWTIIITFICLVNTKTIPGIGIPDADKVVHAGLYFFFTLFWYLYFRGQLSELEVARVLLFVFLVAGLYGVMIELVQEFFTSTRHADINDVFANLAGALAACILLFILGKYREKRTFAK